METNLPTPMTARVYVYLPQGSSRNGDSINRIGGWQGWSTEMVMWYFSINACQHKGDSTARNGDLTSRTVVFPSELVAHCLQPSLRNFGFRILNSFHDWMIILVYSSDIFTYRMYVYTYICAYDIYIYRSAWWFGTSYLFFHSVGNVIIPAVELHHFSEGLGPILDIRQVELEHTRLGTEHGEEQWIHHGKNNIFNRCNR